MQDKSTIQRLYQNMLLIRQFEQKIVDSYSTDVIKSPVHLSIGQEAAAVGVCDPLEDDDIISNTYRCHATHIAKGGCLNQMMAELYGKVDGCAGGKAGSMHLIDMKKGVLGASAVVGTTIPVAMGYAKGLQLDAISGNKQRIVVAMFGDGATEEGAFTESINFAILHQLPIIFVCENNRLAIHSPLATRWSSPHICERISAMGMRTYKIDDNDIFAIHDTMTREVAKLRQGQGPCFIEIATYRWMEHVGPGDDHHETYRSEAELAAWQSKDQIPRLAAMLSTDEVHQIAKDVDQQITHAIAFATKSAFPSQEHLYTHVYAS